MATMLGPVCLGALLSFSSDAGYSTILSSLSGLLHIRMALYGERLDLKQSEPCTLTHFGSSTGNGLQKRTKLATSHTVALPRHFLSRSR